MVANGSASDRMPMRPGCLWNRTREQGVAIGSRETGTFRSQQVAGSIPAVGSIIPVTWLDSRVCEDGAIGSSATGDDTLTRHLRAPTTNPRCPLPSVAPWSPARSVLEARGSHPVHDPRSTCSRCPQLRDPSFRRRARRRAVQPGQELRCQLLTLRGFRGRSPRASVRTLRGFAGRAHRAGACFANDRSWRSEERRDYHPDT